MNYVNKLPEMKQSKVALHSGRSCSCVRGHNEVEVTHFQHFSSLTNGGWRHKINLYIVIKL